MTSKTATRRNDRAQVLAATQKAQATRDRRRRIVIWAAIVAVVGGVVATMMLTSRSSTSSAHAKVATGFTLTDTSGSKVSLADYRGRNVLLFFNEGAGCGACFQQMAAIERDKASFDRLGVTVLPISMNSRAQLVPELTSYGVKTPFLLDDGTVSKAYKTIGRGMHAGLPGHSFVLVDKNGTQRWYGEYPSMYLATPDLLKQVKQHLPA